MWAAAASDAELPKVHSLSLGAAENEVGDDLIGRMNTEMAALGEHTYTHTQAHSSAHTQHTYAHAGARGVSVVFASGDSVRSYITTTYVG